ncbi:MAG: hypothetical protein LIR35_01785 [Bacteroidota bacterium]|nr:hypothetical protein [Bacteroidota bacterium]
MRRYGLIGLAMFASALFGGCADVDVVTDERQEIEVCLDLKAAASESGSATKASSAVCAQERTEVRNLWVLQFDGTAGSSALLAARYYPDYASGTKVKLYTSDIENSLLFIANTYNPVIEFGRCRTLDDAKHFSVNVMEDTGAAGEYVSGRRDLYMNCCLETVVGEAPMSLEVPLRRNAVRLDVRLTNSTGGTDNPVTIDSLRLCSVPRELYYFTDYELPELYPDRDNTHFLTYKATKWSDGEAEGDTRSFTFYCPANKRGTVTNPEPKDKMLYAPANATYLHVIGTDSRGERVSYRFFLGRDLAEDCNLLPNTDYRYEFEITEVGDYATDSRVENIYMHDYTAAPLANSYMVHPPSLEGVWKHVRVPVRRVYDFWNATDGYEKVRGNALEPGSFGWQAEIVRSTVELVEGVNFKWEKRTGSDYTDYFEFSVASGLEGNFIIGVHRFTNAGQTLLDDVFLWSWHFWVTDYDPDATIGRLTPVTGADGNDVQYVYEVLGGHLNRYVGNLWKTGGALAGQFMMDRNLGALSDTERHGAGTLYYQLGRKDPFMYASSMNQAPTKGVVIHNRYNDALEFQYRTQAQLQESGNLTDIVRYTVYHPDMYILMADWTNQDTDADGNLYRRGMNWSDTKLGMGNQANLKAKSFFDPCPPGWRVAPVSSMTLPSGTVSVNYPAGATGVSIMLRKDTLPNGAVIYRPYSGYSAFGGPASTYTYANGVVLWSNQHRDQASGGLTIDGNNNRGVLHPVRCVSYTEP